MITQVLCTIGYSSPFPQLALLVSIIFHFIKIITPRPLKDCIKLFWTGQATPGSSSHIGYQQVLIPHIVRRRYLKACGLERKGEDKITVKKREGTPLKQTNNIYVVKRKKRKKRKHWTWEINENQTLDFLANEKRHPLTSALIRCALSVLQGTPTKWLLKEMPTLTTADQTRSRHWWRRLNKKTVLDTCHYWLMSMRRTQIHPLGVNGDEEQCNWNIPRQIYSPSRTTTPNFSVMTTAAGKSSHAAVL